MTIPTTVHPSDTEILALNRLAEYFSESPSKYQEAGHGTQYHAGAPGVLSFARAVLAEWGMPTGNAIESAVRKLHSAKGRYHNQLAACELYDLFGLKNYKPGDEVPQQSECPPAKKVVLELPEGDTRTARVRFVDHTNDPIKVCISVSENVKPSDELLEAAIKSMDASLAVYAAQSTLLGSAAIPIPAALAEPFTAGLKAQAELFEVINKLKKERNA